ncbi:DUF2487 family protein [Effusibacillus dendaii]|uniref:DUF2487 family protein n=1 Tax=Effusibacillus dendaii TaxID=2743772 RepID=A0A7I8DA57_9BACL|nr:DUF2487 family protein [Effusibacillus dendaii]BCJ85410.1 hypothetical protein skT53_03950 [Effusibacillus dendaii]
MKITELTNEQLEQLKPYIDTVLVPIGTVGGEPAAERFAQDLWEVRQIASAIEQRIAGRLYLFPEVVFGGAGNDSLFSDYLYHLVLTCKDFGADKAVLLYRQESVCQAVEQSALRLRERQFQTLAVSVLNRTEQQIVDQIVALWQNQN